MAAGLMRRRFGPMTRVETVGVSPGEEVDAMAVVVMDEAGVDIAGHLPRGFADIDEDSRFDLIVSLSPEAHHHGLELAATMGAQAEYWPTMDPSLREGSREQGLMEYRSVRDGLDARIAARFARPSTG